MHTFIVTLHVIVGFFMILCVLLQSGKSGGGVAFGGSGNAQSIFGASGAGNFLTKTTTTCAFIFMTTSLALTYMAAQKAGTSIVKDVKLPAPATAPKTDAPAAPGAAPAAGSEAQKPLTPPAPAKAP